MQTVECESIRQFVGTHAIYSHMRHNWRAQRLDLNTPTKSWKYRVCVCADEKSGGFPSSITLYLFFVPDGTDKSLQQETLRLLADGQVGATGTYLKATLSRSYTPQAETAAASGYSGTRLALAY